MHWCQIETQRQSFGWSRKNRFITLPGKGGHRGLLPLTAVCPDLGGFGEELYSKGLKVVVQLLKSCLTATPWTAARQASLSFTISQGFLQLISIESVMSSNHLTLCCPLLLLPSIFPSIKVISNESAVHIRWPYLCGACSPLIWSQVISWWSFSGSFNLVSGMKTLASFSWMKLADISHLLGILVL